MACVLTRALASTSRSVLFDEHRGASPARPIHGDSLIRRDAREDTCGAIEKGHVYIDRGDVAEPDVNHRVVLTEVSVVAPAFSCGDRHRACGRRIEDRHFGPEGASLTLWREQFDFEPLIATTTFN